MLVKRNVGGIAMNAVQKIIDVAKFVLQGLATLVSGPAVVSILDMSSVED